MTHRNSAAANMGARRERVYLAGFMGCGKSTIGPILANSIGYDFADLDRMIESTAGTSINTIFAERGEEYFRQLERELLAKTSASPHIVVALGGGTLVDPANLQVVTSTGILVYLKMTHEEIIKRLRHKTDRPMLTGQGGEKLNDEQFRVRIRDLLERREPLYSRADVTVLTDEKKVGITVDQIVRKLSTYIR